MVEEMDKDVAAAWHVLKEGLRKVFETFRAASNTGTENSLDTPQPLSIEEWLKIYKYVRFLPESETANADRESVWAITE